MGVYVGSEKQASQDHKESNRHRDASDQRVARDDEPDRGEYARHKFPRILNHVLLYFR